DRKVPAYTLARLLTQLDRDVVDGRPRVELLRFPAGAGASGDSGPSGNPARRFESRSQWLAQSGPVDGRASPAARGVAVRVGPRVRKMEDCAVDVNGSVP